MDFHSGPGIKNTPANVGNMGSIPGQEDSTCLRANKLVRGNYWDLHA